MTLDWVIEKHHSRAFYRGFRFTYWPRTYELFIMAGSKNPKVSGVYGLSKESAEKMAIEWVDTIFTELKKYYTIKEIKNEITQ